MFGAGTAAWATGAAAWGAAAWATGAATWVAAAWATGTAACGAANTGGATSMGGAVTISLRLIKMLCSPLARRAFSSSRRSLPAILSFLVRSGPM